MTANAANHEQNILRLHLLAASVRKAHVTETLAACINIATVEAAAPFLLFLLLALLLLLQAEKRLCICNDDSRQHIFRCCCGCCGRSRRAVQQQYASLQLLRYRLLQQLLQHFRGSCKALSFQGRQIRGVEKAPILQQRMVTGHCWY